MSNFRVGQKVVCVDDSRNVITKRPTAVIKGLVYTVSNVIRIGERVGLELFEVLPRRGFIAFDHARFRPAVDRPTDISVFTRILADCSRRERVN